ncbi:MAG: hypothetical protein UR69_C0002G0204 [Candidatus Moranbacteria bacterium GW2011_GWE2_35_2-]|nr:MAG: hypothetical protein UR69_C0002G0204 [Candidatus Moranbacteria bacterium GW2011_GWE2_35_2-]KKQ03961.1 MAG: hypothetical protein US15_C0072G0007 [Candidatus Moranbacteria bacterium GW2011_GWF1_36_4]KKQ22447.1 MAG: hypothetical protein US37_C0002G0072 [Candidatus Moranbacteria bacterium GW2011_GWF2_37_11]KKQ29516.1 MAG: hypothetical protein US44_C0001G0108 [Candidatus Moranbacteria bacterium GW2011_GWD1_37_17]KKQ30614.1 MAG: hypothetical protein US47_C0002G0204 [Candidatus Moranbacteria b
MIVLVSYDLKAPGKNYAKLYESLKNRISTDYIKPLESVWLFKTTKSTSEISAILRSEIDQNDSLLVIQVTTNKDGWLNKEYWDWIK